jgi:HEAT repeat protein
VERAYRVLKIHPGEVPTATRFLAFVVVTWTGFAIGASAVESLLFSRFGTQALPYLFIALAFLTFLSMAGMNLLLRRRDPERFLVYLPLGFAAVVLGMRALLEPEFNWVFPVLWLLMMVMWIAQGLAAWGLASALHDTRQAKRLFPLYGAGWIVGIVIGGLATRPLALWIHAENLLLVWAAFLVAVFLIARTLMGYRVIRHRPSPRLETQRVGPLKELRETFRLVQKSPLLLWMAVSLTLLALLYFVLALIFAEAATARFPATDHLAGFLGLFSGASNAVGFLTALFLTNRLFARFGLATMVFTLPLIYLAGFALLTIAVTFAAVAAFRFIQLVWVNGVWAGGWQGLFNVVLPEHRQRVRTFMDGGPFQLGVAAAGVLLIFAQQALDPRQLALIGAVTAAMAALAMWRARRAYRGAVVEALRAGNPEVFFAEEEPFGGHTTDAAAISVLLAGASDSDPAVRRTSMEIMAETSAPAATDAFARGLRDDDPRVRIAALIGVARAADARTFPVVVRLLEDPDPGVRAEAVKAAASLSEGGGDARPQLGPLLSDSDPHVRARAAAELLRESGDREARTVLDQMASSPNPEWRTAALLALGEVGDGFPTVASGLADPDPSIRRAAAYALRGFDPPLATEPLLNALGDPDPTVRETAVDTSVVLGGSLAGRLLEALAVPSQEEAALLALVRLPEVDHSAISAYAHTQAARAVHYNELWRKLNPNRDDQSSLLRYSLKHKAFEHGVNALRAMARDPAEIEMAIDNLTGRDPVQRANALETIEAFGKAEIVRPLLSVWEAPPKPSSDSSAVLLELMNDNDPWLRACAALAATPPHDERIVHALEEMARLDPDPISRQEATIALKGDVAVETMSMLPLMERVLFLRKVRLFSELKPADLKHVAESAHEHLHPDGHVIAEQGEHGDEMHIVVSGEIRVVLGSETGRQVEVARRKPGDYVGEMAVVSEEPRMASLVASGEVRTLSLDRKRFQRILKERPEASLAVLRVLCERLRESHARDPGGVRV